MTAKKFTREIGSVFSVKTSNGFRYLQFVGRDSKGADIFRVTDLVTDDGDASASQASRAKTLYWIQSLGRILLKDHRYAYIGVSLMAGPPPRFRRRFFGGWITICDGKEQFVSNPIGLEVAKMSLDEMLPPNVIVERLEEGWLPEQDRDDVVADIGRMRGERHPEGVETKVKFFVDFDNPLNASKALKVLKKTGYVAELEHDVRSIAVTTTCRRDTFSADERAAREAIISTAQRFGGSLSGAETFTNSQ